MTFSAPSLLWLLAALPLLILVQIRLYFRGRNDLRMFLHGYDARRPERVLFAKWGMSTLFLMIFFALYVMALAEPKIGEREIERRRDGLDLTVVFDVSRSMYADDIEPTRLAAARDFVGRIAEEHPEYRIAMTVFRGSATRVLPMTADRVALRYALEGVGPGMITSPGTAIGAGIRVGLTGLPTGSNRFGAMLLVTDGEALSGDDRSAADEAAFDSVPMAVLGVGTPLGSVIRLPDGDLVRDREQNIVTTTLDERRLQELATRTQGVYARIDEPGAYDRIARFLEDHSRGRGAFTREPIRRSSLLSGLSLVFLAAYLATRVIRWRDTF